MSVWNFEAAEIEDSERLRAQPIYETPEIREFLKFSRSPKRIIAGLKGTGKTLFLKLLSHHYRNTAGRENFTFVPTTQLTERLYSVDYDFSEEKAKAWSSQERWKYVWRAILSIVVLKALRKELPRYLLDLFPESLGLSIGAHLSVAIRSRAVNDPRFQSFFSQHLDSAIQSLSQPVAVFVDNVDEALQRHAGYDLSSLSGGISPQSGTHEYNIWLAGQIGLILAIRELTTRNSHLKIFGTVRTEAMRDNPSSEAFNTQSIILDLRYTRADLRGIFRTKLDELRRTDEVLFPRPDRQDSIDAFFLESTVEHPSVVDENGAPYSEDIFEYLRRHTRGRPRELDFLGYELQTILPQHRTPDAVRNLVRTLSDRFYQYAKNEAVPYWSPELDELLERLPSNFLSRGQAEGITKKLGSHGIELWNALYANGLCGAVVKVYPDDLVQRFTSHDRHAELSLPDFHSAKIWVLHPCVNIATRPRRKRYDPDPMNVAGHAYPYVQNKSRRHAHIHLLIGAGKLGLGLVVPKMMQSGFEDTKLLIAARGSGEWGGIATEYGEIPRVTLRIDSGPELSQQHETIDLWVISDRRTHWRKEIRTALSRGRCTVLVYHEELTLTSTIELADSIGLSVGGNDVLPMARLLANLPIAGKAVLAYENDESAVAQATKVLHQKRIRLIPTVVDRICVRRRFAGDEVIVTAEKYHGDITALVDGESKKYLPPIFSTNRKDVGIRSISDPDEFAFARERKKRLVNSLHAVVAGLVHIALREVGARPETADDRLLGLLSQSMDIHSKLILTKELMILAVLGTIKQKRLAGIDPQNLIAELNQYAEQALKRIVNEPDAPSRVLRIESRTLEAKYRRLFSDVEELATSALENDRIRAVVSFSESEIKARLTLLNEAFLRLFRMAAEVYTE